MKDSELTARWPSERMRLLAQAAFHADAATARQAWQSWEEEADFDDTPFAELRLFPVMARRLTELGLDARDFPRVKGVRRFIWAKSLAVLDAASPLVDALRKAGIPLVVLKGGARHLSPDLKGQERFISDLDILLPRPERNWK